MKIDETISTAVGQPLESFPLLKTAHFPKKMLDQTRVMLGETVIERVRNNKASNRLSFPRLSGIVEGK